MKKLNPLIAAGVCFIFLPAMLKIRKVIMHGASSPAIAAEASVTVLKLLSISLKEQARLFTQPRGM
ncbi:hypothetical protein BANRA_05454 [Klebsiella pneumoniae]|nr:hypothetical protein BANRA_05454 [Klebsiella pneumoniae]